MMLDIILEHVVLCKGQKAYEVRVTSKTHVSIRQKTFDTTVKIWAHIVSLC